eukprot:Gb_38585 [translate_table: standard]
MALLKTFARASLQRSIPS